MDGNGVTTNEESGTKDDKVHDSGFKKHVENENGAAEGVNKVLEQVRDSLEMEEEKLVTLCYEEKLEGDNESTKTVDKGLDCLKDSLGNKEEKMEESTSAEKIVNGKVSAEMNTVIEQVKPLEVEFEKVEENHFSNELNDAEVSSEIVKNVLERLRESLATEDEESSNPALNENETSDNINKVLDQRVGTQVEKIDAASNAKKLEKENESPETVTVILEKESVSLRTEGEQFKVSSSEKQIAKEIETMENFASNLGFESDSISMEHEISETKAGNEVVREDSATSDLGGARDTTESATEHFESVDDIAELKNDCDGKIVDKSFEIDNGHVGQIIESMDIVNEFDTVSEKVSEDIALEAHLESIPNVKQFLDAVPKTEDGDNKVQDMEIDSIETEAKILDSKITVAEFSVEHSSSENVKEIVDSNKHSEHDNIHV